MRTLFRMRHALFLLAAAGFVSAGLTPALAVNGCCQGTPPTACGAPVSVDHKGTKGCTIGWYKASCKEGYKNCTKKDWMIGGPKMKAR